MFQNCRLTIIPGRFQSTAAAAIEQQKHLSLLFFEGINHTNSSAPIRQRNLLGKEIGIHRQFHPPITGYNKYRYSIHQLVDRPTGVFSRLLYRALYLQVKAIYNDQQFHIPIDQTIGIDRQFHVPIGHSNRYRSTMRHT